jgi:ribulose-phosphate 3-epimerase
MKVSASLYAADPLRLQESVAAVAPYVGSLHIDVMDGRFAPAFGFGEQVVRRLIEENAPPIDVHLMVEEPARWAPRFAALGVRSVAFHVEAVRDVAAVVRDIRAGGARAYAALLPGTETAVLKPLAADIDGVLLLTVPPGGGALVEPALERVSRTPKGIPTIVDGQLQPAHFEMLRKNGVELAVLGAALFGIGSLGERARQLSALAAGDSADGSGVTRSA